MLFKSINNSQLSAFDKSKVGKMPYPLMYNFFKVLYDVSQ